MLCPLVIIFTSIWCLAFSVVDINRLTFQLSLPNFSTASSLPCFYIVVTLMVTAYFTMTNTNNLLSFFFLLFFVNGASNSVYVQWTHVIMSPGLSVYCDYYSASSLLEIYTGLPGPSSSSSSSRSKPPPTSASRWPSITLTKHPRFIPSSIHTSLPLASVKLPPRID